MNSNLPAPAVIESVLIRGDLSKLSDEQRGSYYLKVCDSVGLNPLTKPLEYMVLNGKTVLYAGKNCAEQLRSNHKISIEISEREFKSDVYIVTAKATLPSGRVDESTGVVATVGLKGDQMANALMKAETKAKRRVTLSICGLGMLDETEVDSIPEAKKLSISEEPTDEEINDLRPAALTLPKSDHGGDEEFKPVPLKCSKCRSNMIRTMNRKAFRCSSWTPGSAKGAHDYINADMFDQALRAQQMNDAKVGAS